MVDKNNGLGGASGDAERSRVGADERSLGDAGEFSAATASTEIAAAGELNGLLESTVALRRAFPGQGVDSDLPSGRADSATDTPPLQNLVSDDVANGEILRAAVGHNTEEGSAMSNAQEGDAEESEGQEDPSVSGLGEGDADLGLSEPDSLSTRTRGAGRIVRRDRACGAGLGTIRSRTP